MNTQSYKLFIEDIKSQNRGLKKEIGFEIHHILPKALGGDNTEDNLVKLSYYEHIIAHYLLTKETNNSKMIFAFQKMLYVRHKKLSDLEIESFSKLNDFYKIREDAINLHRKRMIENNPMKNENVRKKASESLKEFYKNNPNKGKEHSEKLKKLYNENPDLREKASIRQKEISLKNPEQVKKNITSMREAINKNKEVYSKKLKDSWNAPGFKESRSGENHPMKKEENRKKASDNMKNLWNNETYRANQSQSIKNGWNENNRNMQSNKTYEYMMSHPERINMFKESMNKFWSNEENKKRISDQRKNTYWFNNGEINVKVKECPEGFVKGRLKSNKSWYTDGVNNIMSDTCPEGFHKGRTIIKKENK